MATYIKYDGIKYDFWDMTQEKFDKISGNKCYINYRSRSKPNKDILLSDYHKQLLAYLLKYRDLGSIIENPLEIQDLMNLHTAMSHCWNPNKEALPRIISQLFEHLDCVFQCKYNNYTRHIIDTQGVARLAAILFPEAYGNDPRLGDTSIVEK